MNQFSALSHFLPRQLLTITRESILSCPALSTMFPGRLDRLATGADSTKPQRLACAGCTTFGLCSRGVRVGLKANREVFESGDDRGGRGCVNGYLYISG